MAKRFGWDDVWVGKPIGVSWLKQQLICLHSKMKILTLQER